MSSLPQPEEKAVAVRRMFDRIAPSYDRMNRLLTLGLDQRWRRWLVRRLAIGPDDRVLDLASGTGDFAQIAGSAGANVTALDFARAMLDQARRRDLPNTSLVQGDAERLPFASGSFDAAVSGFALRNFAAIPPVLGEVARILRPGGRLGLLEVDRPPNAALRAGHAVYFDRLVPVIGGALSDRQAYRYLPQSTTYLPDNAELQAMVANAGFHDVERSSHLGGAIQTITAVRA